MGLEFQDNLILKNFGYGNWSFFKERATEENLSLGKRFARGALLVLASIPLINILTSGVYALSHRNVKWIDDKNSPVIEKTNNLVNQVITKGNGKIREEVHKITGNGVFNDTGKKFQDYLKGKDEKTRELVYQAFYESPLNRSRDASLQAERLYKDLGPYAYEFRQAAERITNPEIKEAFNNGFIDTVPLENPFKKMPKNMLSEIISHLDLSDHAAIAKVDKHFKEAEQEDAAWVNLARDFTKDIKRNVKDSKTLVLKEYSKSNFPKNNEQIKSLVKKAFEGIPSEKTIYIFIPLNPGSGNPSGTYFYREANSTEVKSCDVSPYGFHAFQVDPEVPKLTEEGKCLILVGNDGKGLSGLPPGFSL